MVKVKKFWLSSMTKERRALLTSCVVFETPIEFELAHALVSTFAINPVTPAQPKSNQ
jgi:hypothetical protein